MLRTLLASGTLFLTIAVAVALGIYLGYWVISAVLRLLMWARPASLRRSAPAREPAPTSALSLGAD